MLSWKAQNGLGNIPESVLNFPLAKGKCLFVTKILLKATSSLFPIPSFLFSLSPSPPPPLPHLPLSLLLFLFTPLIAFL